MFNIFYVNRHKPQSFAYIAVASLRCSFYLMDLATIFNTGNALKREYEFTGLIIHKGINVRISRRFRRSVSRFIFEGCGRYSV